MSVFRSLIVATVVKYTSIYRSVITANCRGYKLSLVPRSTSRFFLKGLLLGFAPGLAMSAKPKDLTEVIKQSDQLVESNQIKEAFDLLSAHKDAENVEIQWRLARVCYRLGKYHTEDQSRAKELSQIGIAHADRAIQLDQTSYAAFRWKGVLLNWSMQFEGYKKQIEKSFEIRENFDKACELNPTDATSRHLLGRWCYEVANVPWYMRKAAQYIFTTPPSSSYEESLENFKKAEELNPGFYCPNLLYIGKCYLALGKKDEAKIWLEKTTSYKREVLLGDDNEAIEEAKKLLKSI